MQEQLFRFCGIDPIKFWVYTPAETELMIRVSSEKYSQEFEFESTIAARLCAVVLNANGAKKKNKQMFETADFMSSKKKNVPMSEEQAREMMRLAVIKCGGNIINA